MGLTNFAVALITGIVVFSFCVLLSIEKNEEKKQKCDGVVYAEKLVKGDKELKCPPCGSRKCVIVGPVRTVTSTCDDCYVELDDISDKYDALKRFCDPQCAEELNTCISDIQTLELRLNSCQSRNIYMEDI